MNTAVLFLLVMAIVWAAGLYRETKRDEAWQSLADEYGGALVDTGAGWFSNASAKALELNIEGFSLRLDSFWVQSGRSRKFYQRLSVMTDATDKTMLIYKETPLLSDLGKSLGGQDVIVGDAAFDDAFVVKTNIPSWLKGTLGSEHGRRARRAHLNARAEGVLLKEDGMLECQRRGRGGDAATCRAQIELALGYAHALSPAASLSATATQPELTTDADTFSEPPDGTAW